MFSPGPIVVHASDGWTAAAAIAASLAAAATLVLAFFTYRLAKETRAVAGQTQREADAVGKQVSAANDQVLVSQATLDAQVRPWLTVVPWHTGPRHEDGSIDIYGEVRATATPGGPVEGLVPLRNVGPGIAVIRTDASWVMGHRDGSDLIRYVNLMTDIPVVASGDETILRFTIVPMSAAWVGLTLDRFTGVEQGGLFGDFAIDVRYTDWAGQQERSALVKVGRGSLQGPWGVYEIDYRQGPDDTLVTSVRFAMD